MSGTTCWPKVARKSCRSCKAKYNRGYPKVAWARRLETRRCKREFCSAGLKQKQNRTKVSTCLFGFTVISICRIPDSCDKSDVFSATFASCSLCNQTRLNLNWDHVYDPPSLPQSSCDALLGFHAVSEAIFKDGHVLFAHQE